MITQNLEEGLEGEPLPKIEITCFTTHKTNGCIYRAHPDCHGKSWYDSVNITFLTADSHKMCSIPGQILTFIDF